MDAAASAAEAAARRFRLTETLDQPSGALGEGAALRLGLAQATVHGPRVLLLDEPMAALSPFERAEAAACVRALARDGATVLIAATALSELSGCCSDLLELDGGQVVGEGVRRDGAHALTEVVAQATDATA